MERNAILYLAVGFLLGAVLIWILQPDAGGEAAQETLIDGKYITFSNDYGNWIYERQADGTFKPAVKEMTARGLRTIWELQAEFQPRSIQTEGGQILHIPGTAYSSGTGSFSVNHKFFSFKDGKLVEIQVESAPPPGR